jgi:hypothetical protein
VLPFGRVRVEPDGQRGDKSVMTHYTSAPTTRLRRVTTTAAALLLACAASVPAAHAVTGPDTDPAPAAHGRTDEGNDWLYVTVTRGDARAGDTRGTLLRCDPPQGHPHAAQACDQLRAVSGDLTAIPRRDALCSMIYAPVTARAEGRWQGRTVTYTQTFANACVMRARTGEIFALDE